MSQRHNKHNTQDSFYSAHATESKSRNSSKSMQVGQINATCRSIHTSPDTLVSSIFVSLPTHEHQSFSFVSVNNFENSFTANKFHSHSFFLYTSFFLSQHHVSVSRGPKRYICRHLAVWAVGRHSLDIRLMPIWLQTIVSWNWWHEWLNFESLAKNTMDSLTAYNLANLCDCNGSLVRA